MNYNFLSDKYVTHGSLAICESVDQKVKSICRDFRHVRHREIQPRSTKFDNFQFLKSMEAAPKSARAEFPLDFSVSYWKHSNGKSRDFGHLIRPRFRFRGVYRPRARPRPRRLRARWNSRKV